MYTHTFMIDFGQGDKIQTTFQREEKYTVDMFVNDLRAKGPFASLNDTSFQLSHVKRVTLLEVTPKDEQDKTFALKYNETGKGGWDLDVGYLQGIQDQLVKNEALTNIVDLEDIEAVLLAAAGEL